MVPAASTSHRRARRSPARPSSLVTLTFRIITVRIMRHLPTGRHRPGRRRPGSRGQVPGSGYLERMARTKLPDKARVTIGLKVSEADATQIDQVLTRPEFAGWTRAEWCREIVRTALRYYAADPPPPGPGRANAAARPAAAQPAPPSPPSPAPAAAPAPTGPRVPAARRPDAAGEATAGEATAGGAGEPGPGGPEPLEPLDSPESPDQAGCPHPADARDYERGACAV